MQRMSELMEEGSHFVGRQENRLIAHRCWKIADNGYDGCDARTLIDRLLPVGCHPRATAFRLAGKEIHVHHPYQCTVGLFHFVSFCIFVITWQARKLTEGYAVQSFNQRKDTGTNITKFE